MRLPWYCPHKSLLIDGKEHIVEVFEERLGGDLLVTVSPISDSEGQLVGSVHIARDITERKRAEEALRQENSFRTAIIDHVTDGLCVCHEIAEYPFVKFTVWNGRMTEITGYTMEEINRLGWYQTVYTDPELQSKAMERMQRMRLREDLCAEEWEITHADGNKRVLNISTAVVESGEGMVHSLALMQDITERKKIEAEKAHLETLNRQLQKAESLGLMAGAIAHNFNNQLQAVIGNLEMAMIDRGSETLTEALKAAHKAADISALMLTYSGKLLSKHEPIDLSAVCRQSLSLLQATTPKNVIIKGDFPASGPFIRANAGQIQQVLLNLINNAWESVDGNRNGIGLTVKEVFKTDIPAFKRFPVDWEPEAGVYACLEVADAGCGISGRDIEKIFDPFYTSKFTGRGMGLSVVLGIVKAHNGGITVVSEPGRGSIFRIFFPISTEEILPQHDKPVQPLEIHECGTVLLIEDEEQVRKMAKAMLTHLGFNVLEAKDGNEAIEIFQQHQNEIRCVLSDLTMPRMNGWDTLAALRKLSADIPVILSSGYDEAHVMTGKHPELPNAFLGKPYQLKGLREAINRVLAEKKKHPAWS